MVRRSYVTKTPTPLPYLTTSWCIKQNTGKSHLGGSEDERHPVPSDVEDGPLLDEAEPPADPPREGAVAHLDGGRVAGGVLGDGAGRVRRRHRRGDRRAENLREVDRYLNASKDVC